MNSQTSHLSPIRCPRCGGECKSQYVTFTLRRADGGIAIIRNVPADVCQDCGEEHFTLPTTGQLLTALQDSRPPDEIASVPVYDFSQVHP